MGTETNYEIEMFYEKNEVVPRKKRVDPSEGGQIHQSRNDELVIEEDFLEADKIELSVGGLSLKIPKKAFERELLHNKVGSKSFLGFLVQLFKIKRNYEIPRLAIIEFGGSIEGVYSTSKDIELYVVSIDPTSKGVNLEKLGKVKHILMNDEKINYTHIVNPEDFI